MPVTTNSILDLNIQELRLIVELLDKSRWTGEEWRTVISPLIAKVNSFLIERNQDGDNIHSSVKT
jgi:hypothetical protein